MKERLKNWWNKPITRGDYTKWCLYSVGISTLWGVGTYLYLLHDSKKRNSFEDVSEIENDDSENI